MKPSVRQAALLVVVAFALVYAAFGAALGFDFVNFDDPAVIVENEVIEGPGNGHFGAVFSETRDHAFLPLYYASFWIDHAIGGKNPAVYHLINLILHALNAVLLALLFMRLLGVESRSRLTAAGLGAAVFLVHPVVAESVVWASGRKDLLSGLLLLSSLLVFVRGVDRGRTITKRIVAPLIFLAALFAKASVLPGVLLAYPIAILGRPEQTKDRRALLADLVPMALAALVALVVHLGIAAGEGTVVPDEAGFLPRSIGMLAALGRYALNALAPVRLSLVYDIPFDSSFGPLQVMGLSALGLGIYALRRFRRRPEAWGLGVIWFLVALAPFNNILPRFAGVMADRYLYLPMMGVALIAAHLVQRIRPRPLAIVLATLVLAGLVLAARARTEVWSDSRRLWDDARDKAPESILPLLQLGQVCELEADGAEPARALSLLDDAARLLGEAETLARSDRERAQALLKLASLETRRGRFELALAAYERLDAVLPAQPSARDRDELDHARVTRATALAGLGRFAEAKVQLEGIGRESSARREARQNQAAIALLEADGMLREARSDGERSKGVARYQEGLEIYAELTQLHPDFERARVDFVNAMIGARWLQDYEIEVTKAVNALVADFPKNAQAWYHHARVYGEVDSLQALGDLKISVQLDPYREEPYLLLVQLLRSLGSNKQAKLVLDKGLASLPDSTRLRNALAETYVSFGYHHRNTGALDLALEAAARAIEVLPESIAGWQLLGEVRQSLAETSREPERQREEWKAAERAYLRVLELDDRNPVARKGLALFHRVRGYAYLQTPLPGNLPEATRRDQRIEIRRLAMEEFRAAVEQAPGLEDLEGIVAQLKGYAAEFRDLADDALERGKAPEAVPFAGKALRFAPDDPENLALMARTKAALGLADEAYSFYEQALAIDARHLRSLFDFGRLLYERRSWEKAREMMQRFLDAAPSSGNQALADLRLAAQQVIRIADERLAEREEK